MSLPTFVYAHPRENLLRRAISLTVTSGGTEDSYGADKLFDGAVANPCKSSGTDLTVVAEFAEPVLPELGFLLNSNVNVVARLQGHTDNVWVDPDIDLAWAVPTMNVRGFFSSPVLDVTDDDTLSPKNFWRFHVTGNARNVIVGELFLAAAKRQLAGFGFPGVSRPRQGVSVVNFTLHRVPLAYEQAPGTAGIAGVLLGDGHAEVAQIDALLDACRYRARAFPCQPRSDVNDSWMARIGSDDLTGTPRAATVEEVQVPLEMDSRGFPWVEPDDEED